MDLEKIFDITSKKMILEWSQIRESLSQSGEKGTSLENGFHSFLKNYIPNSLGICKGEIIDSAGNSSKQLDTIIFDNAKTIKLFASEDIRVVPVECVYAVIEIKSNIDSEKTIDKIFENMLSVKNLEKKAYLQPSNSAIVYTVNAYGQDWGIWPINYFVFSIDSMKLETIVEYINQKNSKLSLPIWKRIDCICSLNQGVILNKLANGTYNALPEPNSELVYTPTEKALLFFYTLISHYLNQAWLPNFTFLPYLGKVKFGIGERK